MLINRKLAYKVGDLIKTKKYGKLVVIDACPGVTVKNNYYYVRSMLTKEIYRHSPYRHSFELIGMYREVNA